MNWMADERTQSPSPMNNVEAYRKLIYKKADESEMWERERKPMSDEDIAKWGQALDILKSLPENTYIHNSLNALENGLRVEKSWRGFQTTLPDKII